MSLEVALEVGRLYGPLASIAESITPTTLTTYLNLPGLQGFWPMGMRTLNGDIVEHSGASGGCNQQGTVPVGYGLVSYATCGNGNNYCDNASVGQITGTETYIENSLRGLTAGAWVQLIASPNPAQGIVGRSGIFGNKGWALIKAASDQISCLVSADGTTSPVVTGSAMVVGNWHFVAMRWTPSTELAAFIDGDKFTTASSIPASLFVSTQNFEIGRYNNAMANVLDAKVRNVFVCAAAVPDARIELVRSLSMP